MAKHKILVVDDEESLCEILQFNLEVEGYEADVAYNAEQALRMHPERYSLILLDVMMGEMSGFRMAQLLKADPETARVPVIFCTAKDSEDDTVAGLNIGADDYITKPFLAQELLLRLHAVLRRVYRAASEEEPARLGGTEVHWGTGTLRRDGREVPLTAKEFALLKKLWENHGNIVTIDALCQALWEGPMVGYENTLMVHIRRLREKLEADPSHPKHLLTVRGLGYRLVREAAP
mgnify:CR=1 FL=1